MVAPSKASRMLKDSLQLQHLLLSLAPPQHQVLLHHSSNVSSALLAVLALVSANVSVLAVSLASRFDLR